MRVEPVCGTGSFCQPHHWTEGSALVCDEESHPAVSWGAGGWPLEAVLQDFEDLLYVFLLFPSLFQWFDTAPSRTCPQCRNQVKPSPVHTCGTVHCSGTEELWPGVMVEKGSW